MADFTIRAGDAVWLHSRPWKAGQEDALVRAGFSDEERDRAEACGTITVQTSSVDATPAAAVLADEHGIDLAGVKGTGAGGKIIKGDVQAYLDAQATGDEDTAA